MNIDSIKKPAEDFFADMNTDTLVALIKAIFGVIFGFIAEEEGYDY